MQTMCILNHLSFNQPIWSQYSILLSKKISECLYDFPNFYPDVS